MAVSGSSEPVLGALLSERQRMLLLLSLSLCMFMSSLNGSIVATALPQILSDLGGFRLLSWVFTIYLLTSTVAVPVVGKLSDMFGRRPFVIAGVVIFLVGSLASGLAPSMAALIVARGVQGIGGGDHPRLRPRRDGRYVHADRAGEVRRLHHRDHHCGHLHRAHPGRVPHRRARLALVLLHQPSRGRRGPGLHLGDLAQLEAGRVDRRYRFRRARPCSPWRRSRSCWRAPGPTKNTA